MSDKHDFDIVEPRLRAIDLATAQPVEMDWHRAMDIVHATITDPECPDRIKAVALEEMHRLAEAYRLALQWIDLIRSQRDEAREEFEGIYRQLMALPEYEHDRVAHFEYIDPQDVRPLTQAMTAVVKGWNPPVN